VTRRVAALAAVVALAGGGCSSDSGDREARARDLPKLVLQARDLPLGFAKFEAGKQVMADVTGRRRTDPERFGRRGGWKARFRRTGSQSADGPQLLESRADVFESTRGAEKDFEAYRGDLQELAGAKGGLDGPALGAESFALTRAQGSGRSRIRLYIVVWREGNVTAAVIATGFEGRISLAQVAELADDQARRIERILGD
jgi:hypothetical protein